MLEIKCKQIRCELSLTHAIFLLARAASSSLWKKCQPEVKHRQNFSSGVKSVSSALFFRDNWWNIVGIDAEARQNVVVEFISNGFSGDALQVASEPVGFDQDRGGPAGHANLLEAVVGHCFASAPFLEKVINSSGEFNCPNGDGMGLFGVFCYDVSDSECNAGMNGFFPAWWQSWQVLAIADLRKQNFKLLFLYSNYFQLLQWPKQQARRKSKQISSFQLHVHKTTVESNRSAAT